MDIEELPELLKILKLNNIVAIREAIYSIVFICFYNFNVINQKIVLQYRTK